MLTLILISLGSSIATALALHFLTRRHVVQAMESKGLHLLCSCCGLLVARYEQLKDSTIRCANCKRAAERKAHA